MENALDTLVRDGPQLADAMHFGEWSPTHQALAATVRFHLTRDRAAPAVQLVGIVGGASSGKSTLFNSLAGGDHISTVTMASHTTRGLLLASPAALHDHVEQWLQQDGLFPGLRRRQLTAGDRTEGAADAVFVIRVDAPELGHVLLFDTPDFTTVSAAREGDLARHLLPWFDSVFVMADPERFFDRKTFEQLRQDLDRWGVERLVVFNLNERPLLLSDEDRATLRQQAHRLDADAVVLEYRHGRGFRALAEEDVRRCLGWLARTAAPSDTASRESRPHRLRRLLAEQASRVLNENANRQARLRELENDLAAVAEHLPSRQAILTEAFLTPGLREHLSPWWRVVRRSGESLGHSVGRFTRWMPILGAPPPSSPGQSRLSDDASVEQRGIEYFRRMADHTVRDLANRARQSRFWREAGTPEEPILDPASLTHDLDAQAARLVEPCAVTLQQFKEKVETEAASIRVNVVGAGMGLAFSVAMAVLTGGASLWLDAVLGGAIGGVSARTFVRLYNVIRGTQESRALDAAVDAYREGLRHHARQAAAGILHAARRRTLEANPELRKALETTRDFATTGGRP
ncbi:MAG: 50S ribosome-binding GTPase [Phycisphaerae bacterium]|nr:50S ribosome-binding GTPase [Phycisphaerae bacterium]